jgi:hypothetical protein
MISIPSETIKWIITYRVVLLITTSLLFTLFTTPVLIAVEDKTCNIENKNPLQQYYQNIYGGTKYISIMILIIAFAILFGILYQGYSISYLKQWNSFNTNLFILIGLFMIFVSVSFIHLYFHTFWKPVGDNIYYKIFATLIAYVFYISIVLSIGVSTISERWGEIAWIVLLLSMFGVMSFLRGSYLRNTMLDLLKNNKYNFLTLNCFNKTGVTGIARASEGFQTSDVEDPALYQYNQISKEKGNSYLLLQGNVPIQFKNPVSNQYQDFILSDYYYPGSYYSYIEDSPVKGHPSYEALQLALTKYKVRAIHLDVFPSKSNPNEPCVRCLDMASDAVELDFTKCLKMIEKYGWDSRQNYPIFLYLKFQGNPSDSMYHKVYESYLSVFKSRIMNKKYSFGGRNGSFPISKAPMKECMNRVILVSNTYPTRTILDELINAGNVDKSGMNLFFGMELYKEAYVNFDSVGISQDQDKTKLYLNHQRNISFYYTEPNMEKVTPNENKSGLYNPNFQDVAQYGIQGTMMYLFVPDMNLNNWYMYFKSTNNLYPCLKDETLLSLEPEKKPVKEQDPILGLSAPQKYCVIPGFMETEKSNITSGVANNSCGTQ